MRLIQKIKNKFNYIKNYEKEQLDTEKREQELVEIIKRLRNINLFEEKEKIANSKQKIIASIDSKNIRFCSEKVKYIYNFNIEKMSKLQLKNAYDFVKKSINDAEKRGYREEIEELKQLNEKITASIDSKNIRFCSKKIKYTYNFNIEKMNKLQLENAYDFVKKSIKDAEKRGIQEEIEELKQIKKKIKQKLIEQNNDFDIQSIRNTLMLGSVDKIDMYESVLMNLYNDLESKSKMAQFDEEFQQMRIHVLSLLKLIKKIKNGKQYVKKVA